MQRLLWLPLLLGACGGTNMPAGRTAASDDVAVHDIQGNSKSSPMPGRTVAVDGLVAADFQYGDADLQSDIGGFFLQSIVADGNAASSEGLFIDDGPAPGTDVAVGDRVRVAGIVVEEHGETRIAATRVSVLGHGRPRVTELRLPANLEHYEGMLVHLPQSFYVQDMYDLERYGSLQISLDRRVMQFTNAHMPDAAGYALWRKRVVSRSIVLDDGLRSGYPRPPRYLHPDAAAPASLPRLGDRVRELQGVLSYGGDAGGQGGWRLLPTTAPRFEVSATRAAAPDTRGAITVASFNVLNYFTTIAGGRGADSVAELARQRAKTVTALRMLGADVIGLMELENNRDTAIRSLVDGLNAADGAATWAYIDTGVIGGDAIRVALIYRPGRVQPVGAYALLDDTIDLRFDVRRNRPTLAQTFRSASSQGVFTVAVNHLKSKGSSCAGEADADRGDGQGHCNGTRTRAALALAEWLSGDPTGSGDADALIIGDLNAYLYEDPVRVLEEAGYVNVLRRAVGDAAWSFVYRGASGVLDHALATPSLAAQVTGVAEWHINADAAPLQDYNLDDGRDPALFEADSPWRASDHDPLLIGLALHAD